MTTTPTRQLRVHGNHTRSHWWPGNAHHDCAGCQPWFTAANQAATDQALAAKRDDDKAGARAVGTALLIAVTFLTGIPGALNLFAWFTNLDTPTIHHFAWAPLLGITAYVIHRLWKNGQNR